MSVSTAPRATGTDRARKSTGPSAVLAVILVSYATGSPDTVAEHVSAAITGASALLAIALVIVLVVLLPARRVLRRVLTPTPLECTS
ncbi:hypothetical protein [Intrasporangium sp.]|uniref:hypothetical protein n=1 Tax=Intrasporangium sp. TaxID=1925024 RepID=UPI0032215EA5